MNTLKYLMDREYSLEDRITKNFNERVRILYQLDEDFSLTATERTELNRKVEDSNSYEKALKTELGQVRKSMKYYFLKILEE